ncbi:hypothetical protein B0I35DRAFT_471224 [Stachybotrys elegans]|uniref:FAD-binding PCMH-type domain-containing protein n=1 Tax=Stachybotrys elegans TaxID=80388 RepID=A0A8K0SFV6_9HYPO|nr:hypothetical protein B0I35DRAFT_471224 [Stachybotrys elegans]
MQLHRIPRLAALLAVASSCTATCSSADLRQVLLDDANNWSASTVISFPDDPAAFLNATQRWSPFMVPTYEAAITPGTEEDVAKAVSLAAKHGVGFLATGGRHGYGTSMSALEDGLAIDLSLLRSVVVDSDAATLTIGGGTRAADILGPVSQAGFELQIGSCSCPGLVGLTVGAGINHWQGVHGMVLDALVSARVVTASGEIVEASESVNADLFWALRGAGANFGIITSATYRLHPQTNNNEILVVDVTFPAAAAEEYYAALEQISQNQPAELSYMSMVLWNQTDNAPMLVGDFIYLGPREVGLELLAPILDLGPTIRLVNVAGWRQIFQVALLGSDARSCIPGSVHTPYNTAVRNFSLPSLVRSFHVLSDLWAEFPGTRATGFTYQRPGQGAAQAVPNDATAYAWRDAEAYMLAQFSFPLGDVAAQAAVDEAGKKIRADFAQTSGYGGLAVYVNSARGDETLEQIFGRDKLPRLAEAKRRWDPTNAFKYMHAIPTQYP